MPVVSLHRDVNAIKTSCIDWPAPRAIYFVVSPEDRKSNPCTMSKMVMRKDQNAEANDKLEMVVDDQSTTASEITFSEKNRPRWFWPALIVACLLCLGGLVCIVVATLDNPTSCPEATTVTSSQDEACSYSVEAKRVGLGSFLKEVQDKYYEMNPDNVAWQPDIEDQSRHVRTLYVPYDPTPETLKKKTDAARALYDKINNMKIDMDKLKPREGKAVSQVKHFLKHTFGVPYDENYYAGDWMLGPNLFCWMGICNINYDINAFAFHFQPVTYDDVDHVIKTILKHKKIIDQYRSNVALGVTTGMIRTKIDCRAGVDALKIVFRQTSLANDSSGILDEWFTKLYLQKRYLSKLENDVEDAWTSKHNGQNISTSIREALIDGIGQPMKDLLEYLEFDHMRHCLPNDVASGLGGLPVDYVYVDGKADLKNRTTKRLPTGEVLNGTKTYRMILSYFTSTDISPEEIYEEGMKQLKEFHSEIKNITKIYTGKSVESEAVSKFKKVLNSSVMWHNNGSFPTNESDETAFKKCVSPETARKYCPVRWAAIQRWASYCREVMGFLYPKITDIFHFTGVKATAPNCPIDMLPHYNPSNGAQFFKVSDSKCTKPTYFGLPFFLKDYGPVFQEWSVTAHEARPGHHTQIQGLKEHFQDSCGGVPSWLGTKTYYTAFTEGWGLYSENPLISDDTDTYKDNLLQKYGMLKWQMWRAVRLIVDTGLHARNMTRTEALKMFEDYAWDTSDFAVKEVTRYQSDPGQATAYMLGRLELIKMRKKAEKELGSKFSLKDFHYQVLKQGSAPLEFLNGHIDRYIKCVKGTLDNTACQYVFPPKENTIKASSNSYEAKMQRFPPRREHEHYV